MSRVCRPPSLCPGAASRSRSSPRERATVRPLRALPLGPHRCPSLRRSATPAASTAAAGGLRPDEGHPAQCGARTPAARGGPVRSPFSGARRLSRPSGSRGVRRSPRVVLRNQPHPPWHFPWRAVPPVHGAFDRKAARPGRRACRGGAGPFCRTHPLPSNRGRADSGRGRHGDTGDAEAAEGRGGAGMAPPPGRRGAIFRRLALRRERPARPRGRADDGGRRAAPARGRVPACAPPRCPLPESA